MESSIHTIACNNLLILFAVVTMTGIICSKLSDILKVPDVVLFLIAGIFIGPSVLKFIDISQYQVENQLILTFGSAFILYMGGKEISLKVLKNVKVSVLLLSSVGVLISAFLMQQVIGLSFGTSAMVALLAGSIIASTDPATLVPIFNQIKIDRRVSQTVISESAFNDATGAILTSAVLAIMLSGKFSLEENLYQLVIMIIIGLVVGLLTGVILLALVNDSPRGIFIDVTIPQRAAGITPVSLTHIINSISFFFHFACLSTNVQAKTHIGLTINIKQRTLIIDGTKYFPTTCKSTWLPKIINIHILQIVPNVSTTWQSASYDFWLSHNLKFCLLPVTIPTMKHDIYPLPPSAVDNSYAIITDIIDIIGV